jgi:XTP/dITP diphosphohydrolase
LLKSPTMSKKILFITGNPAKLQEAKAFCEPFGIEVEQKKCAINEIQSTDIVEVAIDKVKQAYKELQVPVAVTDAGWSIPALNGFPGPYMKDVNQWFAPQDFLNLMQDKSDKTVILTEVLVYFDGETLHHITAIDTGRFIEEIRGIDGHPSDKVITFSATNETIAECKDRGTVGVDTENNIWKQFAQWYVGVK